MNRTEKQTVKLAELLQYNLQSVRSYLLREDFQRFWLYTSPGWALFNASNHITLLQISCPPPAPQPSGEGIPR